MAQLVKLLDYVSRYEHDLSRYPSQYIRLKRYQWERMKTQWESGTNLSEWQQNIEEVEEPEERKWFTPLFRLFGQRKTGLTEQEPDNSEDEKSDEEDNFGFSPNLIHNPSSVRTVKKTLFGPAFSFSN